MVGRRHFSCEIKKEFSMNKKINTSFLKRQAKKLKKELNITHTEALDLIAKKNGYSNWKHCISEPSKQPAPKIVIPEEQLQLGFTDWLKKHKKRDSPLGDLATDALEDKNWPMYNTLVEYQHYLTFRGASPGALSALKNAWKSYKAYLRRRNLHIPYEELILQEVKIKNKQKYLDDNYPFGNPPKLTDKLRCLHCGSIISVGDYKVFKTGWEEFICCPNAPECDGTVIDWVSES
jgi:hypothetical protein